MTRRRMLARVSAVPELRRALLVYFLVLVSEFATFFMVVVYAFGAGGASAAGIAAAAQLVPAVLVPGVVHVLERRASSPMRVALTWMTATTVGLAVTAGGGALWMVIVTAAVRALGFALVRPIHLAAIPTHAQTTSDTTAAMVVTAWLDSAGVMVGPAAAAAILAVGSPPAVFVFASITVLVALVLQPATGSLVGLLEDDGIERPVFSVPGAKALFAYKSISSALTGATDVLIVVVAIDLLGLGDEGASLMASLLGAGELIGGMLLISVLGKARLRPALGVSAFGRGASLALLGVIPQAYPLLAVGGGFRPLHRVIQRLMLQRVTPPDRYVRMFGVAEAFDKGGQALGALLVPVTIAALGEAPAVVVFGAVLPATFFAMSTFFARLDERSEVPSHVIDAISQSDSLGGLPDDVIEYLARIAETQFLGVDEVLIEQGQAEAEAAWLVMSGEVGVEIDGEPVALLGPTELVGEMALVSNGGRSARVTALTRSTLLRLDREAFLAVVLGGRSGAEPVRILAADRAVRNKRSA